MVISTLNYTMSCLVVLICVSFYTLFERKVLGLSHFRLGPLTVSWGGLLQPFADGLKLFTKSTSLLNLWTSTLYLMSPCLLMLLSLLYLSFLEGWNLSPSWSGGVLGFLSLLIISAYPSILVGWSSTSEWALIGAIRNLAMIISFEVGLSFLLIGLCVIPSCLSFVEIGGSGLSFILISAPWCILWSISVICELNRTPFDLGEAESELVSGVNIEYSGGAFSLLFISEYMNMIFFSFLSAVLILGGGVDSQWVFITGCFIMYSLVWVRATLPRVRYDKMMSMFWIVVMPLVLTLSYLHLWIV